MITSPENGTTDFVITIHNITVGKIGVWSASEIGFLLSREHWGQGIATEALLAVLEYLFGQRGFVVITADVDPRNEKSMKVLEGVGFERTGYRERTFEIAGEWVDSVDLTLKKEDFVKRFRR